MVSGLTHLWISGLLCFSLLAGGVLVDLDHIFSHNFTQLVRGFFGVQSGSEARFDEHHPLHQPIVFKAIFFFILCLVLFGISYFIHLKLDGLL